MLNEKEVPSISGVYGLGSNLICLPVKVVPTITVA